MRISIAIIFIVLSLSAVSRNETITTYYLDSISVIVSSEDIVIPFDTCTQISCDSSGNFFDVNFDGLQPERNYRFLFKIERGQNKEFFDNNYYFKVVRNSKIPN